MLVPNGGFFSSPPSVLFGRFSLGNEVGYELNTGHITKANIYIRAWL